MRTGRAKRSESFWPSIVMKKWLNVKPKVHEFSEDEVDTESDDDDATNVRGDLFIKTVASENESPTQATGTPTKVPLSRRWRRKSETLRVQYISKKDVRVMIGTWNVAGKNPNEDLEIDEWLHMGEPADMYVLGFQEVVPLNAGNVLGAEDSRPIPKWETIIRRTLSKSLQPNTKCKSYSAPPSPVSRTSALADLLLGKMGVPGLAVRSNETVGLADDGASKREGQNEPINLGKTFQWNRIYPINSENILDWPEYSLDMPPQALSSGTKLRRVLSSSPRIGFDWTETPQVFASDNVALDVGLKRVYHSSGNLGMLWQEQQEASEVLNSLYDVSDESDEEDSFSENVEEKCEDGGNRSREKSHARYVRIASKQMVGIYISVWVCRKLRRHINNLKVSPVGVGLMGYMGNKGSVSVSMSLFQTRLCFVCSHLTSGHKVGDQQKRNSDVYDILQRTRFSSVLNADQPQTIPSHDRIFWFGDLNYRVDMLDAEIRALIARKKWDELINSDQLSKELRSGHIFDGWKEGFIDFPPTYKYEINSDLYVGEKTRGGEKKRSPAWCDRILWLGKGIRQLSYWRSELDLSDHRPVSSMFLVEVEVFDQQKLQRVLNFTNAGLLPEVL